ncbi:MAG: hypothetical protein U9N42_04780 [Campylobacterota bacterium]|nr:hypothetical protein [Campylobacterota bacterium]
MKSILIASALASSLFAGIMETEDGTFLEIFSESNPSSTVVASVSSESGNLERVKCRSNKESVLWCKVRYSSADLTLNGWVDKKSLDTILLRPNEKPTFETHFGGGYTEVGNAILPLKDGLLLVGSSESFGSGQNDVFVVKTDYFGNKQWSATYGGAGEDVANAVIEMGNSFILAGNTRSFGNKDQSIYAARITKDGKLQWQNGYYSDSDDRYIGKSIAKINDSHVMIAGSENHIKFFNSENNCYLAAISTNGQHTWEELFGGAKIDKANSIIKVKDGFVFVGETESWGHGNKDAYVVKIDEGGKQVWHNIFGHKKDEIASQVIQAHGDNYLIVGTSKSARQSKKDVYIAKIDKDGGLVWQHNHGTREDDEGMGVVKVADGYVILSTTKDTKNYKKGILLIKVDKSGNTIWKRTYASQYDKVGNAIAKVKDGFVITGYTKNTNNHNKDMYLLKVDNDGYLK